LERADHPHWKGFRVVEADLEQPRVKAFVQRANQALLGHHTADLMGPTPYSGETPEKIQQMDTLNFDDDPGYKPEDEQHFNFVFANGQVHVSPAHDHDALLGHAGQDPDEDAPVAVGDVTVRHGKALWRVETNVGQQGLRDALVAYSHQVGWDFEGQVGTDGQPMGLGLGPVTAYWYREAGDEVEIAKTPFRRSQKIYASGGTAWVHKISPGLEDWAEDFGLKLAEYPGGGNMHDKMKTRENLDQFNNGDPNWQPERDNPDEKLEGPFSCKQCGQEEPTFDAFRLHMLDHEPADKTEIEDGHFPQMQDFDIPLGFGTQPVPNGGNTIAMVLSSDHEARRFPEYAEMAGWGFGDDCLHYGAYRNGEMLGFAITRHGKMVAIHGVDNAVAALWEHMQRHSGNEPKDMIEDEIPFVFDIPNDRLEIGYAGSSTHDVRIPGKFTPGGIIEGYYQPGGKLVVQTASSWPISLRHLMDLWYYQYPQMEITSLEEMDQDGSTTKLAAVAQDEDPAYVGNYLYKLVNADLPAQKAYRALKAIGGKVYVVGGAVRDALQSQVPSDVDLLVAGLPSEEVEHALHQLPGRLDFTGKNFGVFRYRTGGSDVEIALPRSDTYETGRRGEGKIKVDPDLPVEKDLERRDFTANSMAVDLDTRQLIDPYGGAKDIERGVLRTTHSSSFKEDPTRLVRALTAHGRFGLMPDERTRHEMEADAHLLRGESPDSMNKVIDKMMKSSNPAGAVRLGQETGILHHIFPEVADNWDYDQRNPHHNYTLGDHLMQVLDNTSRLTTDPDVRMAAMMHDAGKPLSAWIDPETGNHHYYMNPETGQGANHEDVGAQLAHDRMRQLNYPRTRIQRVQHLIQWHMFPPFNTPKGARKFLHKVGDDHADDLLNLREADQTGKGQTPEEVAARTSANSMRGLVEGVRSAQEPTQQSALNVNGNDLIQMGLTPGPQIGQVLRYLTNEVVENPMVNQRDQLLQLAQSYVNAQPQQG
jgi:tRNA nucleotidyltransferase (CCA-adding enzyme)